MQNHPFPRLGEYEDAIQAREGDYTALQYTLFMQTVMLLSVASEAAENPQKFPLLPKLLAEITERLVLIIKIHPDIEVKQFSAMLNAAGDDLHDHQKPRGN